jgi:hypothetical protein
MKLGVARRNDSGHFVTQGNPSLLSRGVEGRIPTWL